MSDIMIGDYYEKPLLGVSKGAFMKLYQKIMKALTPSIIIDMASNAPKILTAFGGSQIMRVNLPGNELDITGAIGNVQEDTSLLLRKDHSLSSNIQKRRNYLSKPKNSSQYTVNPAHVYTVEMYDHSMNFETYHKYTMGGKIDSVNSMNGQVLAFCLFSRDKRVVWKFPLWHEKLLEEMKK